MNGKIQQEVERLLDSTTAARYKCPFCGARRGISWDPKVGDTGVVHCFSCQTGLTGVQVLAKLWHGSADDTYVGKVCEKMGVDLDTDEVSRAVRRAKGRHEPERSDAEERLLRVERARERMRPVEASLYDALVEESRCTPHEDESKRLRRDIETLITSVLNRPHFLDTIDGNDDRS